VFPGAGCQPDRHGAGLFDGARVVLAQRVKARPVAVPECDSDQGARHMRPGTGIPSRPSRTSIWRTKASTSNVRQARRSSLSA